MKKHSIDKALLQLYADVTIAPDAHLVLFTWVIGDGLGDFYAQQETHSILRTRFPSLKITCIILMQGSRNSSQNHLFIPYELENASCWESVLWKPLGKEAEDALRSATALVQLPTYYPHTPKVLQLLHPKAKYELLGEYSWINTPYYHPESKARCMGLHPLEKGIFIKLLPTASLEDFQDKALLQLLFKADTLEEYRCHSRFNLAYTCSSKGFSLYLATLLRMLEKDTKNIDVACFNMHHLIEALQELPMASYNLSQVVIHDENQVAHLPLKTEGKTLRLIKTKALAHPDFLMLLQWTEDLAACRGDASLSEAISAEKLFFPDLRPHQHTFIKDLAELAKEHIPEYPKSIAFLECCFEQKEAGHLLQDPDVQKGVQKLCRVIKERYSVNDFLGNLVARALYHSANPHIEILEQFALDRFLFDEKSREDTLEEIATLIK